MSKQPNVKRPGWYFIEKYVPDALPEEQEAAYENLRDLARLAVEIDDRLKAEHAEKKRRIQPTLFDG